jgi:hypothetical protein
MCWKNIKIGKSGKEGTIHLYIKATELKNTNKISMQTILLRKINFKRNIKNILKFLLNKTLYT